MPSGRMRERDTATSCVRLESYRSQESKPGLAKEFTEMVEFSPNPDAYCAEGPVGERPLLNGKEADPDEIRSSSEEKS